MRVRAIDSQGDWTFGKGRSNYITDLAAIRQNIRTRLLSFLGDCFFATNDGIAWFDLLGSKDQLQVNLAVSSVILNTQFVTGLQQLSISLNDNRQLTIQYEVQTAFSKNLSNNFTYVFS